MAACILRFNTVPSETPDNAAEKVISHNGEFLKGVWVPYFSFSDGQSVSQEEFETRFDEICNAAKKHGLDTLIVHVRAHCDAAYPSKYFPMMEIFDNDPNFDPLDYMVEAAHREGLAIHAWINPYRISDTEISTDSPEARFASSHDTISFDGGVYLDPASEEARGLIIDGVREIAENYDADGIHLDDYFYPFTDSDIDSKAYGEYVSSVSGGEKTMTLTEWRCSNVNALISGIYKAMKSADRDMLFGISPQGNIENDLEMGADAALWCSTPGYIDYIAPQLYYNSENPVCPFEETADRWKSLITAKNVKLYLGLGLYKAGSDADEGTWLYNNDIIASQIKYARSINADGVLLYSLDYLDCEQTRSEMDNADGA